MGGAVWVRGWFREWTVRTAQRRPSGRARLLTCGCETFRQSRADCQRGLGNDMRSCLACTVCDVHGPRLIGRGSRVACSKYRTQTGASDNLDDRSPGESVNTPRVIRTWQRHVTMREERPPGCRPADRSWGRYSLRPFSTCARAIPRTSQWFCGADCWTKSPGTPGRWLANSPASSARRPSPRPDAAPRPLSSRRPRAPTTPSRSPRTLPTVDLTIDTRPMPPRDVATAWNHPTPTDTRIV